MSLTRIAPHLHFAALLLLAAGLSTSVFLMSLGGILLAGSWVAYGNIGEKIRTGFRDIVIVSAFTLFALHLLGVLWSDDLKYAFNDIRIKIPLALFPLVMGTLPSLSKQKYKLLLVLFVSATLVSTFISFGIYHRVLPSSRDLSDIRNISPFVSHIRLSLVICVSILALGYLFSEFTGKLKWLMWIPALWFLYFLYLIESATGIFVMAGTIVFYVFYLLLQTPNKLYKIGGLALLLSIFTAIGIFVLVVVNDIRTPKESKAHLDTHTPRGEPYMHEPDNDMMENGYYTWCNVSPRELKEAWNQRSEIGFDSLDRKKQPIMHTMIRYITSKGYRKDKDGVDQLTDQDITNIENGIANVNYLEKSGLRRRLEEVIFEIDAYRHNYDAIGNSVTQRVEFWMNGWVIFTKNPIAGVGTGDAQLAFNQEYEIHRPYLAQKYRLRSHNQFLAMMVAFGIIGLIIFLVYLTIPFIKAWREKRVLFLLFFAGAVLSFLTEDTLETQAGVTYFCFFSGLFLYQAPASEKEN